MRKVFFLIWSVWPRRCGNELQISLFGRKPKTVTRPVRDEIHFLICLPVVRFETLRQSRTNPLRLLVGRLCITRN